MEKGIEEVNLLGVILFWKKEASVLSTTKIPYKKSFEFILNLKGTLFLNFFLNVTNTTSITNFRW